MGPLPSLLFLGCLVTLAVIWTCQAIDRHRP
jgi:hypothetical protein